ncbi:hypothetical protein [uncultured Flavobacterium sp.]|uniref:hypothetical protein n=1 Tax=uncultured Flavobacterium sp. TaxID=165435 RepID=UPI0025F76F95|nr:hypothetical protein [uncultured Flavobacterium sp.]
MTKTIEIRFLAQPLPGDSFTFTVNVNGVVLNFSGGASAYMYYANFDSAPHGIAIQPTLAQTVAHTMARMQYFITHPSFSYAISGNSVLLTITYEGTLAIDEVAGTTGRIAVITEGEVLMLNLIDEDKLRMAYNNDIIRFRSTGPTAPLYSDITFAGTSVRLYPNPQGDFYFNFRPYVGALINTRNFEDISEISLNAAIPGSFITDFANGTFLSSPVTIAIATDGGSVQDNYSLQWLAGVEQIDDFNHFTKSDALVLSPMQKSDRHRWRLWYWQGYPFDIPLYMPGPGITVKNLTNGLEQDFELFSPVNRLYLSDGRTDSSIEDMLPLADGHNELRMVIDGREQEAGISIGLQKIPYSCGVYVKWLNRYGGYNYWLFENTYSRDRATKSVGELYKDDLNLANAFGRSIQIGRESRDTIKVVAELLDVESLRILEGIVESPKVYMFTGQPFSRNDYRDWVEVALKTGNARIRNPKHPQYNFTLDFELPERYTQTL